MGGDIVKHCRHLLAFWIRVIFVWPDILHIKFKGNVLESNKAFQVKLTDGNNPQNHIKNCYHLITFATIKIVEIEWLKHIR